MNKKYLIVLVSPDYLAGKGKYVAGSKAPNDVTEILTEEGFEIVPIVRRSLHKLWGVIESIIKIWWNIKKIPRGATIYVQYPMFNVSAFYRIAPLFKKFNSVILIHDIRTYCQPFMVKHREKELTVLNYFNSIIVHSESMKNRLKVDGVNGRFFVLGAFDYLLDDSVKSTIVPQTIMFAGALAKSEFLKDLHKLNMREMSFHLYGANKPDITYNDHIKYKGKFTPDDISSVEAEWGLLWDGNSIDTCSGFHGEYLKLIAPHKFSLYLACGLKIICWEHSAMAEIVREKKLGIIVSCLEEIEETIKHLTYDDISIMERNVAKISVEIRHGAMLKRIIKEIK